MDDLKAAFAVIGDEAKTQATRYSPRSSGRLIQTVKVSKSKNRVNVKAGSARIPYAGVQNYGDPKRNISAVRFMQRADSAVRPMVIPTLERELSALIEKQGL
ncbi:hypothetical protein ACTOB_003044 [Actinoplanes oblitus]|uniref:HK97 gp10 family phage protein n=1 Tax=Actinoplanes oblitus TaxID=3040509 RepID=A0ABY8WQM7_9ACTN|nr:hypothetical protein [Actinoplanes oblitus]WIM99393.1 hypothetical protein ACTOB_003044 [Actinoplanes oblitus]